MKNHKIIVVVIFLTVSCFSLEIVAPDGWRQQTQVPQGIVFQYISPARSANFSPNLNVSQKKLKPHLADSLKTATQLSEYMERIQARMFPMFKVLEKNDRKIGSIIGTVLIASYAFNEVDLAAFQFIFRTGADMVNVVYTCLLGDLDRLRPEFEKSLATLKR